MEAGFLNFHDEEHFSDFSLSLDHHNLLEESQSTLMEMVHDGFECIEARFDPSASLWGTEQELNGDIAVLPISGVTSVIPKMGNIKEDFVKVLTDWQEHIGSLEASDMEEDMDVKEMVEFSLNIPNKMSTDLPENIFQDEPSMYSNSRVSFIQKAKPDVSSELKNLQLNLTPGLDQSEKPIEQNGVFDLASYIAGEDDGKAEATMFAGEIQEKPKVNLTQKMNVNKKTQNIVDKSANLSKKRSKAQNRKLKHDQETEKEANVVAKMVSNQAPVLEARDVKSLLEQFEASESAVPCTPSSDNSQITSVDESQLAPQKKPGDVEDSTLHQNIRDSLPKEVIDRIKASGRKKVISVISAISNVRNETRKSGTRMQDAAAKLSRNKLLKMVTNGPNMSGSITSSVQLDHDYCGSAIFMSNSDNTSECDKKLSDSKKRFAVKKSNGSKQSKYHTANTKNTGHGRSVGHTNIIKRGDSWTDSNSRKDSGLESGDVSDASEEQTSTVFPVNDTKVKESSIDHRKNQQKECLVKQTKLLNPVKSTIPTNNTNVTTKSVTKPSPVCEMKIRSALATSILQLRKGVLTKTKSVDGANQKVQQMVSVLKKPLNTSQPTVSSCNPNESIVTITNSSNNEVQNIIVRNVQEEITKEEAKKPPRKKLNLAEYRSRRGQVCSDSSRTNSPVQPMTLVYVHHVSTTTEPIKEDTENPVWSEREIVSVLKPKAEVEEQKMKPKPPTRETAVQTNETVFDCPSRTSVTDTESNTETRINQVEDRKRRHYRLPRINCSSSRSRTRSRSRSRSRDRSRSRKRRRISHRRSSVSSDSSWSSQSRSYARSTSSSRSRFSRSHSRTSMSRSRSSSRYSSCSRSSSRSNSERTKWSSHRRKDRHERRRSSDKYRWRSSGESHSYKEWRRSPYHAYRKQCDGWFDREKQRQVEERRVIYVGRLDEGITKADLRRRFEAFGPVVDISVHFREHGDNYGFVTFAYKNDAYEAVEHGNDDPSQPRYDLCFGGRRAFCKVKYADLDGMASNSLGQVSNNRGMLKAEEGNTFDLLLKEAQAKLRKRKV